VPCMATTAPTARTLSSRTTGAQLALNARGSHCQTTSTTGSASRHETASCRDKNHKKGPGVRPLALPL
jgi:hypothetical protein